MMGSLLTLVQGRVYCCFMGSLDFDSLDDKYRYCVYCRADCWPGEEFQVHELDCARLTGLFPVDVDLVAHGATCGCGYVFKSGDFYLDSELDVSGADPVSVLVCVECALSVSLGL